MKRGLIFRRQQRIKHLNKVKKFLSYGNKFQYNNPYFRSVFWRRNRIIPPWENKVIVGKYLNTPTLAHSAHGYYRKLGGVTRQEYLNLLYVLEELKELDIHISKLRYMRTKCADKWDWE